MRFFDYFQIPKLNIMKLKNELISKITVLFFFTLIHIDTFARAGGSSSGRMGFWMTLLLIVLLPFFLIYSGILKFFTSQRKKGAGKLINKLEITDSTWNERTMKTRAEEIFLNVQKAWMERNMDIAKDFITNRLYTKYKFQTDDMTARSVKNVLQDIKLSPIEIFSVQDFRDNNKDTFSAKISGTMLDYEIDEKTNAITKGDMYKEHFFEDVWTFTRMQNTWMADEVDNNVSLGDIRKGTATSEM